MGRSNPYGGATPGGYDHVRISPDGAQAAFTIFDGDNQDIWIYDLRRHTRNPLTSDGRSGAPIWTPDGKQVVFCSDRSGKDQLFVQNVDGSGSTEQSNRVDLERNALYSHKFSGRIK